MELNIADIVVTRLVTIEMDDRLVLAKEIFDQASFHHLPVVDEDGSLSGMLSERDLLRAISPHIGAIGETNRDQETLQKRVHQVMTRDPVTIAPHKSLDDASLLMLEYSIGSLPVLEDGKLVGIITWKDLLRAYSHLGRRP